MDLYTFNYNNYFNRIVKKEETLSAYGDPTSTTLAVSFNPGDGVSTKQILNANPKGDYLICALNGEIKSRWFILEANRLRTGQYDLTLRRDLIADNYEAVVNAPAFIEKATVGDDDPAIYNSENVQMNKIKQSETLLKDKSKISWIVGYLGRNSDEGTSTEDDVNIEINTLGSLEADFNVEGIDNWEYNRYVTKTGASFTEKNFILAVKVNFLATIKPPIYFDEPVGFKYDAVNGDPTGTILNLYTSIPSDGPYYQSGYYTYAVQSDLDSHIAPYVKEGTKSFLDNNYYYDSQAESDAANINSLNNKTIKDTETGIVYRIIVSTTYEYEENVSSSILSIANEHITECTTRKNDNTYKNGNIILHLKGTFFKIDLQEMAVKAHTTIKGDSTRYSLVDQPFDMFCIPFKDEDGDTIIIRNKTGEESTIYGKTDYYVSLHMAEEIARHFGSYCYDIQVLPYCPVPECIEHYSLVSFNYRLAVNKAIPGKFNPIWKGDIGTDEEMLSCIIWCRQSQFEVDLDYPISIDYSIHQSVNLDEYRICSPNYNGVFELSVAKNGGVDKFNADCSYKPYSPYIHVAPVFGGLYGGDFNDARGLICGGDFSLSSTSSAWANYQLNNKNYQRSFDRQIESLTLQNKVSALNDILGAAAGSLSGSASGFSMGGAAGAVIGGAVSLAGGAIDVAINKTLRDEQMYKTKDLFNYNIQNIQAIPDSLRKVDAFNQNNKLFPFVEYYTCTQTERYAFDRRMMYDGMTVGRIGTIAQFFNDDSSENYIKAQIIRLDNIGEDTHFVNEIANEVEKGLYFQQSYLEGE